MTIYSQLRVCVSPDLPAGMSESIYRSDDPDPIRPIGEALDECLLQRFDEER